MPDVRAQLRGHTMADMASAPSPPLPAAPDGVWRAPLVPAALAYTAGVLLDRFASVPIEVSPPATLGGLAGVAGRRDCAGGRLPLVFPGRWPGAAFGAFFHHYRRDAYLADDVEQYVTGSSYNRRFCALSSEFVVNAARKYARK